MSAKPGCSSGSAEDLKKIWVSGAFPRPTKSNMVMGWIQESIFLKSSPNDSDAGSDLETTSITFPISL